jgi:hypothetical protein
VDLFKRKIGKAARIQAGVQIKFVIETIFLAYIGDEKNTRKFLDVKGTILSYFITYFDIWQFYLSSREMAATHLVNNT